MRAACCWITLSRGMVVMSNLGQIEQGMKNLRAENEGLKTEIDVLEDEIERLRKVLEIIRDGGTFPAQRAGEALDGGGGGT